MLKEFNEAIARGDAGSAAIALDVVKKQLGLEILGYLQPAYMVPKGKLSAATHEALNDAEERLRQLQLGGEPAPVVQPSDTAATPLHDLSDDAQAALAFIPEDGRPVKSGTIGSLAYLGGGSLSRALDELIGARRVEKVGKRKGYRLVKPR